MISWKDLQSALGRPQRFVEVRPHGSPEAQAAAIGYDDGRPPREKLELGIGRAVTDEEWEWFKRGGG